MSWYSVEENLVKPAEVDATSDPGFVIVRKDFELKGEGDVPPHWSWREMRIPREIWNISGVSMDLVRALSDIYAALAELAALAENIEPHTDDEIKGMTPIYLRRVLMGHMLLADVPERWREEVRELLADDAWAVPAVEQ